MMKQNNGDIEFGFEILISELYKVRYFIIAAVFLVGVFAYSVSLFIPNYYVSKALLLPSSDIEEGKVNNNLSSISNVVGIKLGGEELSKVDIALEILKSRKFLVDFIKKQEILVDLFSAKGWDAKKQTIIYDEDIYNKSEEQWVRKVKTPKTTIPSDWEAYAAFVDILNIEKKSTGFVVLSIKSRSPVLSQEWLDLLIKEINEEMKLREQLSLRRSLNFLHRKVADTSNASIRDIFYRLIESQTQKMMLTESKPDYALEILDPPVVSVTPSWPNGMLIIALSMLATFVICIFVILIRISVRMGK